MTVKILTETEEINSFETLFYFDKPDENYGTKCTHDFFLAVCNSRSKNFQLV